MKNVTKLSMIELAMNATRNNITTVSKKVSILDMMFKKLYTEDRQMSKSDMIAEMSLDRLQDKFDNDNVELTTDVFMSDDVQKEFHAINKTVKNGFEASVCNGQTQASFSANKRFVDYKIVKSEDHKYSIVKK